jgi:GGDEF domain-containing protein/uncharacterized membrane protein
VSLLQKCRHYFSSFYVKLFALLLVVVPTAAIAGDFIYASAVTPALQRQSERIIDEFDNHDLPPDEILRSMDKLGLAWLYVSDTAGNINPKYKAFAPDIKEYRPESRPLAWHGQRYYEVTAVKDNRVYHAGYRMEPLYDLLRGARVPVGYIALIFGAMALATAACFHILVSNPLKALPSRLHRVLTGAQNDRSEVEGLLVASQITSLDRELAEIADAQRQKLTKELSDVKNDLREVIQRERQQKFSNALLADLHEADSTESVLQVAMHRVQDRFPGQISAGLAYVMRNEYFVLQGHFGLTVEQTRTVGKLKKVDAFVRPLETGLAALVSQIPEIDLRGQEKNTTVCLIPLMHRMKPCGVLLFYINGDEMTAATMQQQLKEVAELTARVVPTMLAYETEMEANRSDEMTGVTKVKYLEHHLEKLRGLMRPDERVTALFVEGDGFIAMNTQYGKQTGNDLIKELCNLIVSGVTPAEQSGGILPLQSHVFRVGAAGFLCILRNCESKKAGLIAERVRKYIEGYRGWPGGVPGWTAIVTHATVPEPLEDLAQLLPECEIARDYLRQYKKANCVLASSTIPRQFRQKHQGNELGGSLNVFQPAALLQSLAVARRTGLMEVVNKAGHKITIYVENGAPKKARLKRLSGNDAIIEFVSTFEEGDFQFREFRADIGAESISHELTGLGNSQYDVTKALEGLLLDGALASDHIVAAKTAMPQMGLFLIRELRASDTSAWEELRTLKEPPSQAELDAMQDLVKLGAGANTLNDIITKRMEHVPTHVTLRAAQLLYEHKLVKLSPVKMLATF